MVVTIHNYNIEAATLNAKEIASSDQRGHQFRKDFRNLLIAILQLKQLFISYQCLRIVDWIVVITYAFILVTNQEQAIDVAKLAYDEGGMKAKSVVVISCWLRDSNSRLGSIDGSQQANRTNRVRRRIDTKSPRRTPSSSSSNMASILEETLPILCALLQSMPMKRRCKEYA
ncbi:hypothetical protein D918_09251 [Trichuris suis]|nr:hypothetical protein D918_09251 [Trichuris suis]